MFKTSPKWWVVCGTRVTDQSSGSGPLVPQALAVGVFFVLLAGSGGSGLPEMYLVKGRQQA